jgi:hypothetical protein
VTLKKEEYSRAVARWAVEALPRFQIADWPGEVLPGGTGTLFGLSPSEPGTRILMEATTVHRRPDGSGIDVTSHRADDYGERKGELPMNMLLRTERERRLSMNARQQDAELRRLRRAVSDGSLPWSVATINVAGDDVPFEVLEHKHQWVAIGVAHDVFVTIDSYGVDLSDVRLVTTS